MPIVNMMSNTLTEGVTEYPEGACCWLYLNPATDEKRRDGYAVVTWESHHGLCIREREANYYDDSDFYMTVWDEEREEAREILFATTRGWTYPCMGSSVDATPEVLEKYEAWLQERRQIGEQRRRESRVRTLLELRADVNRRCDKLNLSRDEAARIRSLRNHVSSDIFEGIVELLSPRLRSAFRISLRDQVLSWARGDTDYDLPLSPRQMECVR